MSMQTTLPLEGIKVIDFSVVISGPYATKYLADHGAEVIKVESAFGAEALRQSAPYKDNIVDMDHALLFAKLNSNKLGITLNLNHPRGVEIARRLVAWADVVVESFTPGTMKRWGLGYDDLKEVKPDIIMVSTNSQGQTGQYARHLGFGYQAAALAGYVNLTGWPDREAVGPTAAYTDYIAPWFVVIATLAALHYRHRTGRGLFIDISQLEDGVLFLSPAILDYVVNGRVQSRMGNRSTMAVPHGAYRCRGDDRWCAIAVFTEEEWEAFSRVIGDPEWTKDAKFATFHARKENEDELDKLVNDWTVNFSAEEVMSKMQAAGVPAGVVQNTQDLHDDPQLRHREYFRMVNHPKIGNYTCALAPFRLSQTPAQIRRPAPCLGEHNEYVYTKLLGISDDGFVQLLGQGAFD